MSWKRIFPLFQARSIVCSRLKSEFRYHTNPYHARQIAPISATRLSASRYRNRLTVSRHAVLQEVVIEEGRKVFAIEVKAATRWSDSD